MAQTRKVSVISKLRLGRQGKQMSARERVAERQSGSKVKVISEPKGKK